MRDWADEPWVKLYIRDEADWKAMPFDAQAVLLMLLRKVDRAGFLNLGRMGFRALPGLLGHTGERAEERIMRGFKYLLQEDGCLKLTKDGRIYWPNYSAAQSARSSDKLRQQQKRERDRALAEAEQGGPVDCHAGSVTLDASRTGVTLDTSRPHVTNRIEENRVEDTSSGSAREPVAQEQKDLPLPGAPIGAPAAARRKKKKKGEPRKLSREEGAWAWMQTERAKVTDASERAPKPAALKAMLRPLLDELGSIRFRAAYCDFLADTRHARRRPAWPLLMFLATWRSYAPPVQTPASRGGERVKPGVDLYRQEDPPRRPTK